MKMVQDHLDQKTCRGIYLMDEEARVIVTCADFDNHVSMHIVSPYIFRAVLDS